MSNIGVYGLIAIYPKAAKRPIPCAPLLSLNGSTVINAHEIKGRFGKDRGLIGADKLSRNYFTIKTSPLIP